MRYLTRTAARRRAAAGRLTAHVGGPTRPTRTTRSGGQEAPRTTPRVVARVEHRVRVVMVPDMAAPLRVLAQQETAEENDCNNKHDSGHNRDPRRSLEELVRILSSAGFRWR